MFQTSETIKAIAAALAKAQATMHGATKDGKNPAYKSTYATLSSVIDAARGPLTDNGIAFSQAPGIVTPEGLLPIETCFWHGASGEWIKTIFAVPVPKRDPQGFGSATTYGCRYAMMAALGLPPVDDDGEAAKPRNGSVRSSSPPSPARDPFGLDDEPENDEARANYIAQCKNTILTPAMTEAEVRNWWAGEAQARRDFGLSQTEVDLLKSVIAERFKAKVAA